MKRIKNWFRKLREWWRAAADSASALDSYHHMEEGDKKSPPRREL